MPGDLNSPALRDRPDGALYNLNDGLKFISDSYPFFIPNRPELARMERNR